MEMIKTIVDEQMKTQKIEEPIWPTRKMYTQMLFKINDPVTGEELKEYKMSKVEYMKKPFNEQKQFKKMEMTETIDEDAFNKAVVKDKILREHSNQVFNELYKKELEKQGITQEQSDKVGKLIDVVRDDFDFDGMGLSEQEFKIQMEEQFLYIIKN